MKLSISLIVLLFLQVFLYAQKETPFLSIHQGDTLYGTTLQPQQPTIYGVLIVAGSGPTDRNGTNPLGVNFPSYKLLAEAFAENGILSVRYDKRGIAASKNAYKSSESATMDLYIQDVEMVIQTMKKEYPFIQQWTVIGHSEGALLSAAAITKQPVNKYISLSGMFTDLLTIIEKQLKAQIPEQNHSFFTIPMDSIRAGYTVSKYPPALANVFTPANQPFLISSARYAAKDILPQLNIPILIVNGDTDIQVKVDEALCLKSAQPKAKLLIIPKMNHVLKEFEGNMGETVKNYADSKGEIHPQLIKELINFIKS